MALKFLNKKGWHTGSLRNLETVWKAEQKHEAEQKKLEELRAQLHKEREAEELRQLHEAAGVAPRQERLEFLYDSGIGVGAGAGAGKSGGGDGASSSKHSTTDIPGKVLPESGRKENGKSAMPGALFEESNPQSANDKWRKIHSDPLYLIRQQELAALERIRKNPVKMQMLESQVRKKLGTAGGVEKGEDRERRHHEKRRHEKEDRDSRHHKKRRHGRTEDTESRHHKKSRHDLKDDRRHKEKKHERDERSSGRKPEKDESGGKRRYRSPSPWEGNREGRSRRKELA